MEIAHSTVDLWGVIAGVTGLLAFLVTWLYPFPDSATLRRRRMFALSVSILLLIFGAWKLGWLVARMPVWATLIFVLVVAGGVKFMDNRVLTRKLGQFNNRDMPLSKITVKDITFPIVNWIIGDNPLCTKCGCETRLDSNSGWNRCCTWHCMNPDCQKQHHWDTAQWGDYKQAAAAIANRELRKRGSQQTVDTHYRL